MFRNLSVTIQRAIVLTPLIITATFPMAAQDHRDDKPRRQDNARYSQGLRDGGHGGNYDQRSGENYRPDYDDRYHHQGGIGPGKGAAIGGAGGAVLGAIFGGGLKGAVIGGAAGAGVGAVAGKVHQDDRRRDEY